MKHPDPVEGPSRVPWEPLGQVSPGALPGPSETYPGPWKTHGRGNGHEDVADAEGRIFAHVYCWDGADYAALFTAVKKSEAGHEDEIVATLRAQYLTAEHWVRSDLRRRIESYGGSVPTPDELAAAGARPERTPDEFAARDAMVAAAIARGEALRASVATRVTANGDAKDPE